MEGPHVITSSFAVLDYGTVDVAAALLWKKLVIERYED
jgi:hypothetical protein